VSYWCIHGGPDKLEILRDERMKENQREATDHYIKILLQTIDKDPQ
jgi:hypothetical protein